MILRPVGNHYAAATLVLQIFSFWYTTTFHFTVYANSTNKNFTPILKKPWTYSAFISNSAKISSQNVNVNVSLSLFLSLQLGNTTYINQLTPV